MPFASKNLFQAGLLSLLVAAAGCGDDGPELPTQPGEIVEPVTVASSARAKCEALASELCNREAECGRSIQGFFDGPADEQAYVDECERINHADCSEVVAVSTSFNVCLNAVPRAACFIEVETASGFHPRLDVPSSCEDVLLSD